MSRAFVKEADGDQVSDDQPEWPISPHINYVTAYGLQQLNDRRDHLLKQQEDLNRDKDTMAHKISLPQIGRELRYLSARIASAQRVDPTKQDPDIVNIGATVTIIDQHDNQHTFTIVGEDEADIKHAKISWVSPLASSLLGRAVGDEVIWKRPIGDLSVEIEQIIQDSP